MEFKNLRIGYIPHSDDLKACSDRRRFCSYAQKRNLKFEIARPSESYDVVIMTQRGDISIWSKYYKGNTKIIYDFSDSYLAVPKNDVKGMLRGLAKFVSRQSRYLRLNHWQALQDMCSRANAVICSTEEQKQDILKFCKNVHIILDVQSCIARTVKTDYSSGEVFNLVWEGLPQTTESLFEIQDVLESLSTRHKIALHVITDLEYFKYLKKFGKRKTLDITRKLFKNCYLYEWNEELLPNLIIACDIALKPYPISNTFGLGKPENSLLLYWRLGMPAVVSQNPAHERAMGGAGLSMACQTQQDWIETLEKHITNESARRDAAQKGRQFAEKYYGEDIVLSQWDKVINSVLA